MRRSSLFARLGAALALLAAFTGPIAAESMDALREKIMLEAQMESRLRQTLSSFLDTQHVVTVVKVTMVDKTAAAAAEKTDAAGNKIRKWDEKEEIVLPGVPAAASMTKKAPVEEPKKEKQQFGIKSISASIIIGKPVSDATKDRVRDLAITTLGLDIKGEDTLKLDTMPLSSGNPLFGPDKIGIAVGAAGILLLAVFLFGPLRSFFKALNANLAKGGGAGHSTAVVAAGGAGGEGAVDDEGGSRTIAIEKGGEDVTPIHEEFVHLDQAFDQYTIEDLKLALSKEFPDVIFRVIHRLPPKIAVSCIPQDKMEEVISLFTQPVFENPDEVRAIIERVQSRAECNFGGPTKLSKILQMADKQTRSKVMNFLINQHPDFAHHVEGKLFKFEDILHYDAQCLKRIFRKAGTDVFARCLAECPDTVTQQFYEKLGPSITDMLTNKLKTVNAQGGDSDAEIQVMAAVEALSRKGFIPPFENLRRMNG